MAGVLNCDYQEEIVLLQHHQAKEDYYWNSGFTATNVVLSKTQILQ